MFGEMMLLALGRQEAGIDRKGALAGGLRLWPLALTAEQDRLIGVAVHVIENRAVVPLCRICSFQNNR